MRYNADLKWLLSSPEFIKLNDSMNASHLLLPEVDANAFDFQPTHRLGVYFEQLWFHLVTRTKSLELRHKNLQVIIDNHTYGEFDSILQNGNITVHCELAVKFYLQVGQGNKLSDWVGPNLKDRFDGKYQRLFSHQMALSEQPLVQQWLAEKDLKIEQKKLFCRGRLFYPWQEFIDKKFKFPNKVAAEHLKGFWIHYRQLEDILVDTDYQWYQLPRFYWLAEIDEVDENLLPVEKDFSGFSLQKIVALKGDEEVMRGFVVNDDWLHKAQQRVLD